MFLDSQNREKCCYFAQLREKEMNRNVKNRWSRSERFRSRPARTFSLCVQRVTCLNRGSGRLLQPSSRSNCRSVHLQEAFALNADVSLCFYWSNCFVCFLLDRGANASLWRNGRQLEGDRGAENGFRDPAQRDRAAASEPDQETCRVGAKDCTKPTGQGTGLSAFSFNKCATREKENREKLFLESKFDSRACSILQYFPNKWLE